MSVPVARAWADNRSDPNDRDDASDALLADTPALLAPPPEEVTTQLIDDKAKPAKPRHSLELGGRVFVRSTVSRPAAGEPSADAGWVNELDVDSVRFGVEYEDRKHDLHIEVDVELGGKDAELRDGYIRWDPTRVLRLQVGNFKQPISAVSLTSRWALPVIERGLLNDFERTNALTKEPDVLPVGDRDVGVMVVLRGRDLSLRPELSLAVFRSTAQKQLAESLGGNRVPIGISDGFPEDAYARLEVEPALGVRLGASAGWLTMLEVAGTRDTFKHGFIFSLDAVAEFRWVRLWLEGFIGSSPLHLGTEMRAEGRFVAARGILSMPIAVDSGPIRYVEPYASAQYLNASDRVTADAAHELGIGAAIGFSKSWRVQLGYDRRALDNRLSGSGSRVIVQAGAVF